MWAIKLTENVHAWMNGSLTRQRASCQTYGFNFEATPRSEIVECGVGILHWQNRSESPMIGQNASDLANSWLKNPFRNKDQSDYCLASLGATVYATWKYDLVA